MVSNLLLTICYCLLMDKNLSGYMSCTLVCSYLYDRVQSALHLLGHLDVSSLFVDTAFL